MKKVFIYGTGSGAKKYYNKINNSNVCVLGFLDSNLDLSGKEFLDKRINHPSEIINEDFNYILIASEYFEIKTFLLSFGIKEEKIKFVYVKTLINFINNELINNASFIEESNELLITRKMAYNMKVSLEKKYDSMLDYCRYKTLELIKEEIVENKVKGQCAEVGVYKGDFSKIINHLFPDRKLYLFDTFEGFDEDEQQSDIKNGYFKEEFLENCDFKDTSVDVVIAQMKYPKNCIIKKGFFPETAEGLDEKFAFVSIDVDLYKSIYNALEYFYPKLSDGGYIFLHDYKNSEFHGVKAALKEYEKKYGRIKKVPLSDQGGTIVLTK